MELRASEATAPAAEYLEVKGERNERGRGREEGGLEGESVRK